MQISSPSLGPSTPDQATFDSHIRSFLHRKKPGSKTAAWLSESALNADIAILAIKDSSHCKSGQ